MGRILTESFDANIKSFGVDSFDVLKANGKYQNYAFVEFNILDNESVNLGTTKRKFEIGVENDVPQGAVQAWNDFVSSANMLKTEAQAVINYYKG